MKNIDSSITRDAPSGFHVIAISVNNYSKVYDISVDRHVDIKYTYRVRMK